MEIESITAYLFTTHLCVIFGVQVLILIYAKHTKCIHAVVDGVAFLEKIFNDDLSNLSSN